jgi:hypothetical protein
LAKDIVGFGATQAYLSSKYTRGAGVAPGAVYTLSK